MKKDMVITLTHEDIRIWREDEYDDYLYSGQVFVVKKNGEWVGIYNMRDVISIEVGFFGNADLIEAYNHEDN